MLRYEVTPAARKLLDFIGKTEAPRGFDTVFGNKPMPRPLTTMTFDEVVRDGPRRTREYGSSAAGRFQFMRDTLDAKSTTADLKGEMGLTGSELFNADLQTQMGIHLLKRRGFDKFMSGRMGVNAFALNLAKEWASFPVLANCKGAHRQVKRGQSYYVGDGQNKALVKPEAVEALLNSIRPASAAPTVSPVPIAIPSEPADLPSVQTVSVDTNPPALPWWARWVGIEPARPVGAERPGLAPDGDPALWDAQAALDRLGYGPGLLDGLMGKRTKTAIWEARERNGLPEGNHFDEAFKAALPGMKPAVVSIQRAEAKRPEVKQRAPETVKQLDGIGLIGKVILGASGVGAVDAAGALDQFKAVASQASETLDSIQTVFSVITRFVSWSIAHWWVYGILAGIWIIWKAFLAYLRVQALVRQGRLG
jgi:hypothetical protein